MIYIVYSLLILLFVVLGDKQKGRSIVFRVMACLLFAAIVGFRKYTVGVDSESYQQIYNTVPMQNYVWLEVGFDWLIRFLDSLHCEYTALFLVCVTLTAIPMFFVLERSEHYAMTAFMFYTMTLVSVMNGMRQNIAVALFMFAYRFIENRKLLPYCACLLGAMLFHYSCIILFPLYFILNRKLNDKIAVMIYAISFIFVFVNPVSLVVPIAALVSSIGFDYMEYTEEASKSLSALGFMYNTSIYCLLLYWMVKSRAFEKYPILANCVLIAIVFKNLSFNMPMISRITYYFGWFQYLLIPIMINHLRLNAQNRLYCRMLIMMLLIVNVVYNTCAPVMKMLPYEWNLKLFS